MPVSNDLPRGSHCPSQRTEVVHLANRQEAPILQNDIAEILAMSAAATPHVYAAMLQGLYDIGNARIDRFPCPPVLTGC
jgi:hypothetical protein